MLEVPLHTRQISRSPIWVHLNGASVVWASVHNHIISWDSSHPAVSAEPWMPDEYKVVYNHQPRELDIYLQTRLEIFPGWNHKTRSADVAVISGYIGKSASLEQVQGSSPRFA